MAKTKRKTSAKKKVVSKSKIKKVVRKARPKLMKKIMKKPAFKQPMAVKTDTRKPLGEITHFYDHISVAVVKLFNTLKAGDTINIEGHGKSFKQKVSSMQLEHKQLKEAKKGMEIGMKVDSPVKSKDLVYKL